MKGGGEAKKKKKRVRPEIFFFHHFHKPGGHVLFTEKEEEEVEEWRRWRRWKRGRRRGNTPQQEGGSRGGSGRPCFIQEADERHDGSGEETRRGSRETCVFQAGVSLISTASVRRGGR